MKWLAVGAWLTLSYLPLSASVAHTQRTRHPAAGHSLPTHHSPSPARHKSAPSLPSERAEAELRVASLRQGGGPGLGSSSKSASSKKKSSKKKHASRKEPTQMAPTAERISEIQSALARGGYYKTDPNGKWDPDTVDALQKFQSANSLEATGKLDALTLQKLGLGSDVAGVSAPKGITSHSCCSMSPSPSYAPPASASASTATTSASSSGLTPAASASASSYGGASQSPPSETQQNDPH